MITAWYGNSKVLHMPMWAAILIGWALARVEYCLAVPANLWGYTHRFTGGQLKIIREVVTLAVLATIVLKEPIGWRYAGAFPCLVGSAGFMFAGRA